MPQYILHSNEAILSSFYALDFNRLTSSLIKGSKLPHLNYNYNLIRQNSCSTQHFNEPNLSFMGIPTEVISEGFGNNSLRTNDIYLKSFMNHVLDVANELVFLRGLHNE
ncbi:hypothetical protein KO529_11160 [Arenibacter algicola]|uniref:hypothetical protein n=1 Tax=Arenibacter algicola TaxID=616991 RepID=UPI001C0710E8|nr:hypothetical protein [Arenibacter algicola]MBU2905344.1 hypothetical protein [Arenibacter algicola]